MYNWCRPKGLEILTMGIAAHCRQAPLAGKNLLKQLMRNVMEQPASAQSSIPLTSYPKWRALQRHAEQLERCHLRKLFAAGLAPGEFLNVEAAGLYLDHSNQCVTEDALCLPANIRNTINIGTGRHDFGLAPAKRTIAHDSSTNMLIPSYHYLRWTR